VRRERESRPVITYQRAYISVDITVGKRGSGLSGRIRTYFGPPRPCVARERLTAWELGGLLLAHNSNVFAERDELTTIER
jgi:hypothetical protein